MNLYQNIFFRFLDTLRGRNTIKRLKFLRKSQYWDLPTIRHWQLEKLNTLLSIAQKNSPFYADALEGIKFPLKSLEDISLIPILTKDQIRNNQQRIKCTNIPDYRFVESRTGGSTGKPMFYFWDKKGMDWNRASVYRSAEWGNTALGEKALQMSGSHFDYTQGQTLKTRLIYFLQRYKEFSVAFMTDELQEKYYQGMMKYKPASIWGYAGGLFIFADFIEKNHPNTRFDFIKAIFTSSEMLWPHQRETINRVFGDNKVYDQYGSRELYMASECSAHKGYHIHSEVIFAEVVNENGNWCKPGELGNIIFTDLSNHAFPFIRYEIGDLGVIEEDGQCDCGMWLPRLRKVEGRMGDIITLSDRVLTGPNFATLFSDIRGIENYQIRQDKIDEIKIVMVADKNYTEEFEQYVKSAVESMVDKDTRVITILTDKIEVPESGKRQYIISTVSKFRSNTS